MAKDNGNLADKLRGEPSPQTVQVTEQFVARLRGELDGLVRFLQEQEKQLGSKRIDPAGGAYQAVAVLQFARYSPAADLCIRYLDTRSTSFPAVSDEAQVHFPFFPFAVAAAAVGMPAVAGLTAEIMTADPTATRFQLSCLALKAILGEELALLQVTNEVKKAPQSHQGQRLEQATRFIRMPVDDWEATFCSDYRAK
jgi:hypothetical protein